MSHIDTLQAYEDLVRSGIGEPQAKAQVHALNAAFDGVATKADLQMLEKDLKIFFVYLVGGTLLVGLLIPIILKYLGLN
jgi:hypothetical protein